MFEITRETTQPTIQARTYLVGFGDAVRHAIEADANYEDALVEAEQWTLTAEYLRGYRDGAAWAEGAR